MSFEKQNKKITRQAKIGIKGEAFFESIICEYAIPHHVVGPKDMGIDFICEWIHGENPTGVLFAAQIKTFADSKKKPKPIKWASLNKLESFEISNRNLELKRRDLEYLKGLGIPAYLFAVYFGGAFPECYYKRYTPVILGNMETIYSKPFYKVNRASEFIAFQDTDQSTNGFARDLFIDYMRCNYSKGSIAYLNPRAIGLNQFPDDNIFPDLFSDYKDPIRKTFVKLTTYFSQILDEPMATGNTCNALTDGCIFTDDTPVEASYPGPFFGSDEPDK